MVVDFATSVVPLGRVEECARKAQRLLPGWAIGRDGEETTDPSEVMGGGCLLNLGGDFGHGGHKGYCLSAMVDVLCAVLSGGNWGPLVDGLLLGQKSPHGAVGINSRSRARGETESPPASQEAQAEEGQQKEEEEVEEERCAPAVGIGHFFGALRIDGFREVSAFRATMDRWIATYRSCAPVDPRRPVRVPGDPEWEQFDTRSAHGIPVKLTVLADLLEIARRVGVSPPFDEAHVDLSRVKRVIVDHA